jgi:hypothetical protein
MKLERSLLVSKKDSRIIFGGAVFLPRSDGNNYGFDNEINKK